MNVQKIYFRKIVEVYNNNTRKHIKLFKSQLRIDRSIIYGLKLHYSISYNNKIS